MDALLINLAIVRDVPAGKPLRYRMVDDGRDQAAQLHRGRQGIDHRRRQAARRRPRWCSTDGKKQTIAWVVDGMPVPARILQREDGKDDSTCG